MGRAKQNMELISNERARYVTFQKRKKGLKKKAYELKTLCDIELCMIIYGPKMDDRPTEVEIWPPNPDAIKRLTDSYKNQSGEDRSKKTHDLSHFFEDRKQKIEDALAKLRKKNAEAVYSTWDDRYNCLSKEELREFEAMLEGKLVEVKARVEFMKGTQKLAASGVNDSTSHAQTYQHNSHFKPGLLRTRSMQMGVIHEQQQQPQPISFLDPREVYPFNQTHQGLQLDANSMASPPMMMPMMNNNYYSSQLGGMSSSNFLYNNIPLNRPICFDPMMSGMPENTAVNHPLPPMGYRGSNAQTMAPYLQYLKMASASCQVHASQVDEFYKANEFQKDQI